MDEHPATLFIGGEPYDLADVPIGPGDKGVPYARRTAAGGLPLLAWVAFPPCPACGRPVRQTDPAAKLVTCGHAACGTAWRAALAAEPGRSPTLILIRR
jgi:hypothetical protein